MTITNQEFWPEELWGVLRELWDQSRQDKRVRTPQVKITAGKCPDYVSPTGATREDFNAGVLALAEAGIVRADWQRNASPFVVRIRLEEQQATILEQLLDEGGYLPTGGEQKDLEEIGRLVAAATERYGLLGLKTLSQIVTGDSKQLSESMLLAQGIDSSSYWVQRDAVTVGASLVRVAGQVQMHSSGVDFHPFWQPPGHYLWDWEVTNTLVEQVGERMLLIENPYPMWELMRRFNGIPVTFVCLHGETQFRMVQDSALALFLRHVFTVAPGLDTLIWCDPDPAGLQIADNAYTLVKMLGGAPRFWLMDSDVLNRIEALVLAKQHLKPLDNQRREWLQKIRLNKDLEPLRHEILTRSAFAEQEALVCELTDLTS